MLTSQREKKGKIVLLPGDIILTRRNTFLSRMILRFTRTKGEEKSMYSHCEIVVTPGLKTTAYVVSADAQGVTMRRVVDKPGRAGVVYRVRLDSNEVKNRVMCFDVAARARLKVGKPYPVWRLFMHFLDWLLFDAYLFRRIGRSEDVMECGALVAWAYGPVKSFGLPWYLVSPDDIHDCLIRWDSYGKAERIMEIDE